MTTRQRLSRWRKCSATERPSANAISAVIGYWFATPRIPSVPKSLRSELGWAMLAAIVVLFGRRASCGNGLRHGHHVAHLGDVMNPHRIRASGDRDRYRRRRAEDALADRLAGELANEALA